MPKSSKPDMSKGERLIIPQESQNITREKLKDQLPKNTSVAVTDEVLRLLNNMEEDTGLPQNLMEEEFMTYTYLLGQKKGVSIEQLINAIKYCNLKRTRSNRRAWAVTFPVKYDRLITNGKSVDNHVSMFEKSWLVQQVDKAMLIPVSMQWAQAFNSAMNVNIKMMHGDAGEDNNGDPIFVSPMVRHLAAKTVLDIAKPIEDATINIKIGQSDEMLEAKKEENRLLADIIKNQQDQFRKGANPQDVQKIHMRIDKQTVDFVDAELEDM